MNDGNGSTTHSSKKRCEWVGHFDAIFSEAKRYLPESEARDVATTACMAAFLSDRERPLPRDREGVSRWRARYLYWRLRTHWSRTSKQRKLSANMVEALAQISIDHIPPAADTILDRLEIMNALEDLCSEERTLALEVHVHGYSSSEIAARIGLPLKTVQKRIDKATEKLGRAIRLRRAGILHGFGWFLFSFDARKQGHDFFGFLHRMVLKPVTTSQPLGVYAMSFALGGVMPGDVPPSLPQTTMAAIPERASTSAPSESFPVRMMLPQDRVVAPQDKPSPTKSFQVSRAKHDEPEHSPDPSPPPIESPPPATSPALTTKPPPEPAARPLVSVVPANHLQAACSNAFAEAQTAMNLRRNPRACLEYLNKKPNRMDTCPEDEARKKLRQRCFDKLTQ